MGEHLNMLFFGKICIWRYASPYYLLEFTTFAVDHDPNASLSCTFTWKPLNCRLNCNINCYCVLKSLLEIPVLSYFKLFQRDTKQYKIFCKYIVVFKAAEKLRALPDVHYKVSNSNYSHSQPVD